MSLELETPEEREARRRRAFELREKLIEEAKPKTMASLYLDVANKIGVSVQEMREFVSYLSTLSEEEASSHVHMFLLNNAPEKLGKVRLDDDGNMQWVPNQ